MVVVILGQRRIDEVQDDARHVDLPIVEQLEPLSGQPRRGVAKANDEDGGVNLRRKAGGVVRREDRRAIDQDVIVEFG